MVYEESNFENIKILKNLISVIIPTYNRCHFIRETIVSIQNQSHTSWEVIVVDDGSDDGTESLMEGICTTDSRIAYFKRPEGISKGPSGCRNFGFSKSNGKYIQWLDDDDLISSKKFENQISALEKINENSIFATCNWDLFWPNKVLAEKICFGGLDFVKPCNYHNTLAQYQTYIPLPAFLIPRELCALAGKWNESLTLNDDAEYMTRVLMKSKGVLNVKNCYILYRNHSEIRISRDLKPSTLRSLLLSLDLMSKELEKNGISAKKFFRWKLFIVFNNHRKIDPRIIKEYRNLFIKYGINLNISWYYQLKHFIYLRLYPPYKFIIKNIK